MKKQPNDKTDESCPDKEGCSNDIEKSQVEVEVDPSIVHVFFDGTSNNRFNTESALHKIEVDKEAKEHASNKNYTIFKDDKYKVAEKYANKLSYQNYYSNIALLFLAFKETAKQKKIYIEGAGSTQDKADSLLGAAFAWGATGIKTRVDHAVKELGKIVKDLEGKIIVLNVYGFSRGAGYARYFCTKLIEVIKAKQLKDKQPILDYDRQYQFNFVGLFDTVSSVGIIHYNDVEEFNLDIGKPQGINRVVHFTAQDDFRQHFPLTRIKGALSDQVEMVKGYPKTSRQLGFECSFPGAHSDIGGSYMDETDEDRKKICVASTAPKPENNQITSKSSISPTWFIKKGYCKEFVVLTDKNNKQYEAYAKIRYKQTNDGRKEYGYNFFLQRRAMSNLYQAICAELMRDLMLRETGCKFKNRKELNKIIVKMKEDSLLSSFRNLVYPFVMEQYAKKQPNPQGILRRVPLLDDKRMKQIYAKYIHNSLDMNTIEYDGTFRSKPGSSFFKAGDYQHPQRPEVTKGYR